MHESRRSAADQVMVEKKRIADEARGPLSTGRWVWEWIRSFLIALGLFLIIRTFLVEAFRIPTGSMENTLLVGDFLLVNKAVYGARVPLARVRTPAFAEPVHADIVVFTPPHDPGRNYVKRIIGMPGDTLEMRDRVLYRNGRAQQESYVRHNQSADVYSSAMFWQCDYAPVETPADECRPTRDNWGPVVVPDGRYFMMGDNRDDSEDSRYWGFAERDAIRGRPLFIYYSFDPGSERNLPWLTGIRWSRVGHRVH
ncbi:MAG TPA: signal peptidase I [Longimicrobiales bacterium]